MVRTPITKLFGLLLLLVAITVANAQTQSPRLNISGRIVDQNGAIVAGAKVTALGVDVGTELTSETNENGEFSILVSPGRYKIRVAADGFSDTSQTVDLRQESADRMELVLPVAQTSVYVTIGAVDGYVAEAVSSGTKTPTALRDIPQSISVMTREQIDDQLISSVADAVRFTPGITAHQGENNRDDLVIRGNRSSSSFYADGVRDDVQYFRDFYNLDRLEALKGPNALVFGRGGGGGVVNRVTKEAVFAPVREIAIQGGSYYNRRIAGDFGQAINKFAAFRLNGVYENSDSFRKYVNLNRLGINPTVTLKPSENTKITLGYEYFRDRRVADRGITTFAGLPADVPRSTYYGNPDDSHVRINVNAFTATFERQMGRTNIRNATRYGDYDRFYQNYVTGASNADATLVNLSAYNNSSRRRNFFNQTDLTFLATMGPVRHTILGGIELGNQRTRNFRNTGYFNNATTTIQVDFDDPLTTVPVTFRQSATDANNRLRLDLAAAYVQDQIEIGRFVQVVAGIRYDYFDLTYNNNRTGDRLRRIDRLASPRFGVVVKPVGRVSLYGSYSVSFLPSSGDQFASLTTVTQQVKPERFTNYEAGVKFDVGRGLSVTAAVFRLDRTNTRATDPNDPTAIIQTGSQRTNGFEAGVTGNITNRWSVSGGYSLQNAFISSSTTSAVAGKQVAQVPHQTFSVWNKYRINSRFGAGIGLSGRTGMFAAADNSTRLPGFVRTDAALYYVLGEHWKLQANFDNIFDARYFANADGNNSVSPGAPRMVRIGLTARF